MYSINSNICKELSTILKHLPPQEKSLIDNDFFQYIEENKNTSYKFSFYPEMPFDKQNISIETKAIIVSIFKNYFGTSRLNEEIDILILQNSDND
jgi:hypothetical protein